MEKVHLETAVPTIIRLLAKDVINLRGKYMIGNGGRELSSDRGMFSNSFNTELHFIHPFKLNDEIRVTFGRNFFTQNFTKMIKTFMKKGLS